MRKWTKASNRTVFGSFMGFLAMLLYASLLLYTISLFSNSNQSKLILQHGNSNGDGDENGLLLSTVIPTVLTLAVAALAEAVCEENDNLVLPLLSYSVYYLFHYLCTMCTT